MIRNRHPKTSAKVLFLTLLLFQCPSIETVCVDLSDWDDTVSAVKKLGDVDLLVNNAGVINLAGFMDIKPQDFDEYVRTVIC